MISTAFIFVINFLFRISRSYKNWDQNIIWFVIATLISLLVFPKMIRLNIIMFMFFINPFCAIVTYCIIIYNLHFRSLNLNKASKIHTRVTSSSFLQQVPGLSNRYTFSLANGLYGRFLSRYWLVWIGFGLCPSRELVWHLRSQVNNGLLYV